MTFGQLGGSCAEPGAAEEAKAVIRDFLECNGDLWPELVPKARAALVEIGAGLGAAPDRRPEVVSSTDRDARPVRL